MSKIKHNLPFPVKRSLIKLGQDIRNARKRRRIQIKLMAERAFVARSTINKIEKGDPSVGMGIYATVLYVLGLLDRLTDLADITSDKVGLDLEDEALPQRIRYTKNTKSIETE